MKDEKPDHINIMEESVTVSICCPREIRDAMQKVAVEEDRTLSRQVVRALREWLRVWEGPTAPSSMQDQQ